MPETSGLYEALLCKTLASSFSPHNPALHLFHDNKISLDALYTSYIDQVKHLIQCFLSSGSDTLIIREHLLALLLCPEYADKLISGSLSCYLESICGKDVRVVQIFLHRNPIANYISFRYSFPQHTMQMSLATFLEAYSRIFNAYISCNTLPRLNIFLEDLSPQLLTQLFDPNPSDSICDNQINRAMLPTVNPPSKWTSGASGRSRQNYTVSPIRPIPAQLLSEINKCHEQLTSLLDILRLPPKVMLIYKDSHKTERASIWLTLLSAIGSLLDRPTALKVNSILRKLRVISGPWI